MRQDALGVRVGNGGQHIDEVRPGRLREDRRRRTDVAQVDGAGVHGLQHRRPSRELGPAYGVTQVLQALLEVALRLQHRQADATFLEPEARLLALRAYWQRGQTRRRYGGGQTEQNLATI